MSEYEEFNGLIKQASNVAAQLGMFLEEKYDSVNKECDIVDEKNEKYPQLVLETNGTFTIYIDENVPVLFETPEAIEDFCRNKMFNIIGKKSNRSRRLDVGDNLKFVPEIMYEHI